MEVFSPLVDVQPITPSISSFWDRETSGIESAGENTAVGGDSSSRRSTFGSPASAALRRFPSIEDMEKEQRRLSLGSSQVIGLLNAALFFFVVRLQYAYANSDVYIPSSMDYRAPSCQQSWKLWSAGN
jgi:hypothetical protein